MRNLLNALDRGKVRDRLTVPKRGTQSTPVTDLLYKSQFDWLTDKSPLMIAQKGRQVGFSWTDSLKSVIDAILNNKNTYYTSFNKDTTENYIRYCIKWTKALNHIVKTTSNTELINNRDTLIYRLKFTNGSSITALAGNAVNLRDKSGAIVIDEAAFRQDLNAIIDAAMAILIWGGSVRIFSTHFGVESDFNKLWLSANDREFSTHSVPFRKALSEGLYKRVCLRKGEVWTQDKEGLWTESLYKKYGAGASQELDCIPSDDIGMGLFKNITYTSEMVDSSSVYRVRSWDLAATEQNGCFSVGSLISYNPYTKVICVEDIREGQWGAIDGDRILVSTARADGMATQVLIEQEAGSESLRWTQYITNQLTGYNVQFIKPASDKLSRAIPLANALNLGTVQVRDTPHNREMMAYLKRFSSKKQPLVTDLCDSLSQGFNHIHSLFYTGLMGT